MYNFQKEMLYFLLGSKKYNHKMNLKIDRNSTAFNDFLNLNLLQLKNLEKIKKDIINIKEMNILQKYVEDVIDYIQNPSRCLNLTVYSCPMTKGCGFSCQIHHLLFCLSISLGNGGTAVITRDWPQSPPFEEIFYPLSRTCNNSNLNLNNVIEIPIHELYNSYKFDPTVVPKQILNRIENVHSTPYLWWIGQMIKYIMRMRPETLKKMRVFKFNHPIVGYLYFLKEFILEEVIKFLWKPISTRLKNICFGWICTIVNWN